MNEYYRKQFQSLSEYNGWTNYPTWAVNLWMDNDQASAMFWERESIDCLEYHNHDRSDSIYVMEERLKEYHEENNPIDGANAYADVLSWALQYVNWREIAEHLIDSAMEEMG